MGTGWTPTTSPAPLRRARTLDFSVLRVRKFLFFSRQPVSSFCDLPFKESDRQIHKDTTFLASWAVHIASV